MVDGSDRDLSTQFESAISDANGGRFDVLSATSSSTIDIPDGEWILGASFDRLGHDLVIEGRDGERLLVRDYFSQDDAPDLSFGEGTLRGAVVERLAGPAAEGFAQTGASDGSAIGTVDNAAGEAWVVHVDGSREPVVAGTSIYSGDVVETSPNGSLTIAFIDGTSLSLSEDARMVIDELVFDPGSAANTASFSLVQGLFVLVSGDVAKTGDMTIETPVSTIGIRGTSVAIQAATEGLRNLITLLADPDGNVGIVEVATLVARVILDTLGASTSVTSANLAPTPVEVLTAEQIETAYRAALTTMQTRTGTSLGVQRDVEGNNPDNTNDNDDGADAGDPTVEEVEAFYQAVQDLIAALQNVGVDGEDLTEAEEDELVEQAAAVVIQPKIVPPAIISLPEKIRNETNSGTLTESTSSDSSGSDGTLRFKNNATDSFGTNESAQFGVADSGALGTQTNNPTSPTGFVNTTMPGGFYFNPNGATNFSDPITSGTPSSGYTISYQQTSLDASAPTTVTGKNANTQNQLGVTTNAAIQGDAVVATSEGHNSSIGLTQTVTLTAGTSFIVVEVLLENLSTNTLMLYYLQSINPNQDAVGVNATQQTFNQVVENPGEEGDALVVATGPNSGVDFVMYADQTGIQDVNDALDGADVSVRASVSPTNTFENDPSQTYLYADPDLGGTQADVAINLTYLIESLGAGESAYLSFVLSLNIASSISDFLFTVPGHTTIDGLAGDDTILGGSNNDMLFGGSGDDHVDGQAGNDQLQGGTGNDQLSGDEGDDLVVWQDGDGSDAVDGGEGTDTLSVTTATDESATVSVTQNADHDVIVGVDGAVAAVADNVERLEITTGSDNDTVIINNLLGTDLDSTVVSPGSLDAFVVSTGFDRIWLNDGTGSFTQTQSLSDGSSSDVVLGDVNGDGFLDAVVSNGSAAAQVFLNDGEGSFTAGGSFGAAAQGLAIGDFDDDGDLDVFLLNSCGGSTVFSNNGNGTFSNTGQSLTTVTSPQAAAVGDLDDDGDTDIVVAGFAKTGPSVRVLVNDGDGTFSSGGGVTFGGATDIALADLDDDGDLDAAVSTLNGASVLLNDGSGNFTVFGPTVGGVDLYSVALGDIDDDGDIDMAVVGDSGIEVFQNSGSGVFTSLQTLTGSYFGTPDVVLGDLDGDGDLDIFLASGCGTDRVFLNQGDGSFVTGQNLGVNNAGKGAALGDLDGDGESVSVPSVFVELGDGDDNANAAVAGVAVQMFGEGGDDTLIGGVSDDTLDGGSDDDVLAGNLGDDVLSGESGNDSLQGGAGDDTLFGGSGDDTLDSGFGEDVVFGSGGNDVMLWEAGSSSSNSDGDDSFDGGSDQDILRLLGQGGDDTFIVTAGGLRNIRPSSEVTIQHEQSGDNVVATNTELLEFHGGEGADHVTISDGLGGTSVEAVLFEGGDDNDILDALDQTSENVEITAFGGEGDDELYGGYGRDELSGDDGDDYLYGNDGDDTLDGGDGNDGLAGGYGNDVIRGGIGDDVVFWEGGYSYDYYYDVTTYDSDGDDLIFGGDGHDALVLYGGAYVYDTFFYYGAYAQAHLYADEGLSESENGAHIHAYFYYSGANVTAYDMEEVVFYASNADTTLVIDNDLSVAGVSVVTFFGGDGNDVVDGNGVGDGGFHLFAYGGAGNDLLIGTGGDDTLYGGAGNDELVSTLGQGNDTLDGGAGNDLATIHANEEGGALGVFNDGSNDVIVAGFESTIDISDVEDLVVVGSDQTDLIFIGALGETSLAESRVTVLGNEGNDIVAGIDVLRGLDAFLNGFNGEISDFFADTSLLIDGGSGNDILAGGVGNDVLLGGSGNDILFGFAGDDTILGGSGNDVVLWTGAATVSYGNNFEIVLPGGGNDVIDGGAGDNDMFVLLGLDDGGMDVTISGGLFTSTGDGSLSVDVVSDGAELDLTNIETLLIGAYDLYGYGYGYSVGSGGNDHVVIQGDIASVGVRTVLFYGGDGDDTLDAGYTGDGFAITADGGYGDDLLIGGGGDDVLGGSYGNDGLAGGDGNDDLDGDDGNDELAGGEGDDYLYGGEGNDQLEGNDGDDVILGENGNDRIEGGQGNDLIYGGAGNDVIFWYGGHGSLSTGGDGNDLIDGGDDHDILSVLSNDTYQSSSVTLSVDHDLELSTGNATLIVDIEDPNYSHLEAVNIEQVNHSGGSGDDLLVIDGDLDAAGVTRVVFYGFDGDDVLYGNGSGDGGFGVTAHGGDGNDTLVGTGGNDLLYGGADNDLLVSALGQGNDLLDGGSGNDRAVIYARQGSGPIRVFGDGNDVLVTDGDTTIVTRGIEHLSIVGSDGNDIVFIGALDDSDPVVTVLGGEGDDLVYGAGTDLAELGFLYDGDTEIEFEFDTEQRLVLFGEGGNDALVGGNADDFLSGGDGDDLLFGFAGNDTIQGGAGNDIVLWLQGGTVSIGNDVTSVLPGSGNDTIDGGAGDNDALVIAAFDEDPFDVTVSGGSLELATIASGLTVDVASDNALLQVDNVETLIVSAAYSGYDVGGNDRLVLEGDIAGTGVRTVVFYGGSGDDTLDATEAGDGFTVVALGGGGDDVLEGAAGDDFLFGNDGEDEVHGGSGNDTLDGGEGNDALAGGYGNDVVRGGVGNDVVFWEGGYSYDYEGDATTYDSDGDDLILGGDGVDTLVIYGGTYVYADYFGAYAYATTYLYAGGLPAAEAEGHFHAFFYESGSNLAVYDVEKVVFYASDADTALIIENDLGAAGVSLVEFHGSSGDDLFFGGGGDNDGLFGGGTLNEGGDDYDGFAHGSGFHVTAFGGGGNDVLVASSGDDVLDGGTGNDVLVSGIATGNDRLTGGEGWDGAEIYGTYYVGAEITVSGDSGNDVVVEGGGTTILISQVEGLVVFGGGGNDEVIFTSLGDTDLQDGQSGFLGGAGDDYFDASNAGIGVFAYGEEGNDALYGGNGDDDLHGDGGNDYIVGAGGNDTLDGGAGNDRILWYASTSATDHDGDDSVDGGDGSDTLIVSGGTLNEAVTLSAGGLVADVIEPYLIVDVTSDDATIVARNVETFVLEGSSGNEVLVIDGNINAAGVTLVILEGNEGDDVVDGNGYEGFSIRAYGGYGDDSFYGGGGDDTLYGDAGNDTLDGSYGSDRLYGGDGNDTFQWTDDDGNDVIDGGDDDDVLEISAATSLVFGAPSSGLDVSIGAGTGSNAEIAANSGSANDLIILQDVERISVLGADGNDSITIGALSDTDVVSVTGDLGSGDDHLVADNTDVDLSFFGSAGNDTMDGGSGDDTLEGGSGNDDIDGGAGNDHLIGGSGNDVLFAASGNNTIEGGSDNDLIQWNAGGSSYESAGNDIVDGGSGYDRLQVIGASDAANTFELGFSGSLVNSNPNYLAISHGESNTEIQAQGVESVTVQGGSGNDSIEIVTNIGDLGIDSVVLIGGGGDDVVDASALANTAIALSMSGDGGHDTLDGGAGADSISGGDGNDSITGRGGADQISGGNGDDIVAWDGARPIESLARDVSTVSDGNDSVDGGADFDQINIDASDSGDTFLLDSSGGAHIDINSSSIAFTNIEALSINGLAGDDSFDINGSFSDSSLNSVHFSGHEGNDVVDFDGANSSLRLVANGDAGNDTLTGGDGNDRLAGGADNDLLTGGLGSDTINGDAGDDVIRWTDEDGNDVINGGGEFDRLELVATPSLVLTPAATPLTVSLVSDANGVVYISVPSGTDNDQLTVRNVEEISVTGGNGNDSVTLNGALANTSLTGISGSLAGGDDYLNGGNGSIALTFDGGSGTDTLLGAGGIDTLSGGDGDDLLQGGGASDYLNGGANADTLDGGDGNDTLVGGAGNDHVVGGTGNDTLSGDDGADTLQGGAGNDTLDGGLERDTITGDGGDDTVLWEAGDGNDTIDGGTGNDTLTVTGSDGDDTISVSASGNSIIIIVNNETITASNIEEIVIVGGDGNDQVTVGDLSGTTISNDTIRFFGDDGDDSFDGSATGKRIVAHGGAGNDTLIGSSQDDTLTGAGGNDVLIGNGGSDLLLGGSDNDVYVYDADDGSDTLDDASGTDQISFTLLDGVDLGDQAETFERVDDDLVVRTIYGETLVVVDHFAGHRVESFLGTNSSHWEGLETWNVELLTDAESVSSIAPGQIVTDVMFGTSGNDVMYGGAGFDAMQAGDGNDNVLSGEAGIFYFDAEGNDRIYGSDESDADGISFMSQSVAITVTLASLKVERADLRSSVTDIDRFSSIEEFYGSQNHDTFIGSAYSSNLGYVYWEGYKGDDTFTGGADIDEVGYFYSTGGVYVDLASSTGNDGMGGTDTFVESIENVFGSRFNDVIIGDDGANGIDGFRGDDILQGGAGNDVYRYDLRDGDDTISDTSGGDALRAPSFDQDFVDAMRSGGGNDLVLVASDGGSVTITNQFNGQPIETIVEDTSRGGVFEVQILQGLSGESGAVSELIVGTSGADAIHTTGGYDYIFGGAGDDSITSSSGDGFLITPGLGNDTVTGTLGDDDTVSFLDHTVGATIAIDNSNNAVATFLNGEVDYIYQVLNIMGTAGDDTMSSSAGTYYAWFVPGPGDDVIIGNSDYDYLAYYTASQAIDFTLGAGGNGTFAGPSEIGTDVYTGIEHVWGGRFDDTIVGNELYNDLDGYGGDDVIRGMGGDDVLDGRDGYDYLDGGEGNDEIEGGDDDDTLVGGAGDDDLHGDDPSRSQLWGDDTLYGGTGDDTLQGGNGDDVLLGEDGHDTLDGGSGFDTADFSTLSGPVSVNLQAGTATTTGEGNDTLSSIERVVGTAAADMIIGSVLPEGYYQEFQGGGGNDILTGSSNDQVEDLADYSDATGGVTVDLGAGTASGLGVGNDTLNGIDSVRGSDYADTLTGGNNESYEGFIGGAGNDIIDGADGYDDAYYREDPYAIQVQLTGDNAFSVLDGYGDTDTLSNIERLTGSRYDDIFDLSTSFTGSVDIRGVEGSDTIDGSGGEVSILYNGAPDGVFVDLGEGYARDGYGTIDTFTSVENARGSSHEDTLIGSSADNSLRGDGGNDTIRGDEGDDTLLGGADNDLIDGGEGADFMEGGSGSDDFYYGSTDDVLHVAINGTLPGGSSLDQISDFASGTDTLLFEGAAFGNISSVTLGQNFSVIAGAWDGTDAGTNTAFGTGDAAFIYSQSDGVLYYDDNGSDPGYYAVAQVAEPGVTDFQVTSPPV